MKSTRRWFGILLAPLMMSLSFSGCGYNSLQGLDEEVKAGWSEVENQYQRRADLIPNLVNVVKGYAKHEKETLQAVIEARSKATSTTISAEGLSNPETFKKFAQAQQGLSQALSKLMVVVERYPDLKANANFRDLQAQLEGTENRIAVARNRYIGTVKEFNKKVRFFPTNLTAKYLLDMKTKETFAATKGSETAPKVEF